MTYELTREDIDLIIDFIENGNTAAIEKGSVTRFNFMNGCLQRRMLSEVTDSGKKAARLEKKVERLTARERRELSEGIFSDTGLDSVDVARALLFCLQEQKCYRLTTKKLCLILYMAYASWLYHQKQRLFIEQPQAREFGPVFYRVTGKVNIAETVTGDDFARLAGMNSGVAALIRNAARKYYDYSEQTLQDYVRRSAPYRNALPERHGGKWNAVITDADIYGWKEDEKHPK